MGESCSEDINECEMFKKFKNSKEKLKNAKNVTDSLCPEKSSCVNTFGSFTCDCHIGYEKDRKTGECIDIDECRDPQFCGANMICQNRIPMFSCDCKPGFVHPEEDGFVLTDRCEDINECLDGKDAICEFDHRCKNTIGSFECEKLPDCDPGFRRFSPDYDGVDQSLLAGSGNDNFDGFSQMECKDINECSENSHDCKDHQICKNTQGGFYCEDNGSSKI